MYGAARPRLAAEWTALDGRRDMMDPVAMGIDDSAMGHMATVLMLQVLDADAGCGVWRIFK